MNIVTEPNKIDKIFNAFKDKLEILESKKIITSLPYNVGKDQKFLFRVRYEFEFQNKKYKIALSKREENNRTFYHMGHNGELETLVTSDGKGKRNKGNANSVIAYDDKNQYLCRSLNTQIVGRKSQHINENVRAAFGEDRIEIINDIPYLKLYSISDFSLEKYVEVVETMDKIRKSIKMNNTSSKTGALLMRQINMSSVLNTLSEFKQIVLTGPPGTGKTYFSKKIAKELCDNNDKNFDFVQFHPSYNYEDFVRGIQVISEDSTVKYITRNRVFAEMCQMAQDNEDEKFVLIIDEINRANLAAVLGELIYALEYRGKEGEVITPYEVNGSYKLAVPENL